MRALPIAILGLACGLVPSPAQAGDAEVWTRLHGAWQGEGEVRGMAAEIRLRFREAVAGRGHHLAFENRMRAQDGNTWHFVAEALYQCDSDGACRGHWYDSRGTILPVKTVAERDRLIVDWGDETTERGRTTYRLDGDILRITDEVLGKDGVWKRFGSTTASRDER